MTCSIKDVARRAGVSTATVSHVINKTRYVSEGTREKVINAIKGLNYKPNTFGRNLRTKKSNSIGLIFFKQNLNQSFTFLTSIMYNIQKYFEKMNYNTSIYFNDENILNDVVSKTYNYDGLIVFGNKSYYSLLETDYSSEIPLVFVNYSYNMDADINDMNNAVNVSYYFYDIFAKKIMKHIEDYYIVTSYEHGKFIKNMLSDNNVQNINLSNIMAGNSEIGFGYNCLDKLSDNKNVKNILITDYKIAIGAIKYILLHKNFIFKDIGIKIISDGREIETFGIPVDILRLPVEQISRDISDKLFQLLK